MHMHVYVALYLDVYLFEEKKLKLTLLEDSVGTYHTMAIFESVIIWHGR